MITKESELHHSIGSPIDGAHLGPKTDRDPGFDSGRHHISFLLHRAVLALGQLALCGGGLRGGSCICGSAGMYMKTTRTL